jgi:hypothetical protein
MYFILQEGFANGQLQIEHVFVIVLFLPEGSAWDTGNQVGASLSSSYGVLADSFLYINHF